MARSSLKNISRLIDAAKDRLPPEQMFLADLKRSIEMDDAKDQHKPSQYYKPSSMNCIRNMYYQRTGADPDPSETSYCLVGICNAGTDIHVRVQQAVERMKDNGIDCEYIDVAEYVQSRNIPDLEVTAKHGMETHLRHTKLGLSFLCDGIIRYKGHYYILELKTEASFKWQSRTGVDPSHYHQGTTYSLTLGIPEVLFVYISRDVLDMKAYMFVPTDEQKMDIVGLIDDCEGYVSRQIAPPKPADVAKKTCQYCNYRTRCQRDG